MGISRLTTASTRAGNSAALHYQPIMRSVQSPGRSLLALIMGQAKEISQRFFRASFPRRAIIYPVLNAYFFKALILTATELA
jgi:hypothetical protein